MYFSSAEQVMKIPELVDNVFGYLDKRSLANNARACKQWSAIAFDWIWREVDPYNLFKALAPLKRSEKEHSDEYVSPVLRLWGFC